MPAHYLECGTTPVLPLMQICKTLELFQDALANPNKMKIAVALCDMNTKDPPPSNVVELEDS